LSLSSISREVAGRGSREKAESRRRNESKNVQFIEKYSVSMRGLINLNNTNSSSVNQTDHHLIKP